VSEFEQTAQQLQDQEVKQWASTALPVLKQHLEKAQTIASSLGIENAQSQ
jgi:predicted outer membrane protein